MWINLVGANLTSADVIAILERSAGALYTVEELERTFPVGAEYRNGTIWFQRIR